MVLASTLTCSMSPLHSCPSSIVHLQVSTAPLFVVPPHSQWIASPVHLLSLVIIYNENMYMYYVVCLTL